MTQEPATLEMTVTPTMEQQMKDAPFFLEIEILQGEREDLKDGRIRYKIEIHDMDKAELVKEFILKVISKSLLINGN
jgi:hypothetical protein